VIGQPAGDDRTHVPGDGNLRKHGGVFVANEVRISSGEIRAVTDIDAGVEVA